MHLPLAKLSACCALALLSLAFISCRGSKSEESGKARQVTAAPKAEVILTTPAWDSLTLPLGIAAYYLHVNSEVKATTLKLTLEEHKAGKMPKHLFSSVEFGPPEASALQFNAALYLEPEDDSKFTKATFVISRSSKDEQGNETQASTGTTRARVRLAAAANSGRSQGTFKTRVTAPGKIPLFYIAYIPEGTGFAGSPAPAPEILLETYPEATLLIGYLETKTEETDFMREVRESK